MAPNPIYVQKFLQKKTILFQHLKREFTGNIKLEFFSQLRPAQVSVVLFSARGWDAIVSY